MSSTARFLRLVTLPGLLVALGCASTASSPGPGEAGAPSALAAETSDSGKVAIRQTASTKLAPVYFDTNHSLLRRDARDALKQSAKQVLDHPEWGVLTIDGHCDERGSDEYNLALGERRAEAVVRYLLDLGVPQSRLATRTYGEEKPAVAGHGESAWRFNRRSELQVEALESARR
jgi:peptidoglycan-associated lipoprotein